MWAEHDLSLTSPDKTIRWKRGKYKCRCTTLDCLQTVTSELFFRCSASQRNHWLLDNMTPYGVYFGREKVGPSKSDEIKKRTLQHILGD